MPERSNEVAVQLADELNRDLFGTYRFAFAVIRATAETLVSHCGYHAERPLVALRLTLGERVQVSNFSRGKEHRGCVRASCHAGSAANARSRIERSVGIIFGNETRVRVGSASGWRRNKAPGLNDPIKS